MFLHGSSENLYFRSCIFIKNYLDTPLIFLSATWPLSYLYATPLSKWFFLTNEKFVYQWLTAYVLSYSFCFLYLGWSLSTSFSTYLNPTSFKVQLFYPPLWKSLPFVLAQHLGHVSFITYVIPWRSLINLTIFH